MSLTHTHYLSVLDLIIYNQRYKKFAVYPANCKKYKINYQIFIVKHSILFK